ncbi:hypothetical protein M758_4G188800 [Ceratodon purpureus]|nr:hypothetical protein M758_4G188800 [Ceratodon purpureus]
MTMAGVEELSDDEDYVPVSAKRYFNKEKALVKSSSECVNGNGSTNGRVFGVSSSAGGDSDKSKKSVVELEAFAFNGKSSAAKRPIELVDDDDEVIVGAVKAADVQPNKRRRRYQTIDDSDEEDSDEKEAFGGNLTAGKEASQCADDEALAKKLQDSEYRIGHGRSRQVQFLSDSDEEEEVEVNPITITLQRCDQIAASLREELHASSSSENAVNEDRYAEVDVAAAKIVSQGDVCAACGIAESDTTRMLKPYQLVGVNFMLLLHRKHVGGAILADEMGLGKTVQAVTFLALLKHLDGNPGPHLLVAPASLLENWQRELKMWCPAFKVELYHGPGRASLNRKLQYVAKSKGPAPFNVMLTCYSLFERQSAQTKDDRKFLKKWNWSCVVMDEAHLLKDRTSFRSKKLRDIAHKAKMRLMLTGTPLQNDLQELWSLLEFMMPDVFDTNGVDLDQYLGTRNATSGVVVQDTNLMTRIKGILGPFVLRRMKTDVMRQLVSKIQEVESVEMLDEQAAAYKKAVNEYRALAEAARAARASSKSSISLVDALPRRQVTNIFTQLRKLGNHPLLIRRLYSDETVKRLAKKFHPLGVFGDECELQRVEDELRSYSDFALHKLCITYGGVPGGQGKLQDDHALASAKCQALARLLPKLQQGGHRPLIFSQWTNMLDILEWALDVLGFTYTRLDGSTLVSERQTLVDEFNNDPSIFVFLLSTRAGGQGLNLTGADTVILHDLDFNPQMDRQAEDRCHRIGQSKPVTIYRFVFCSLRSFM